VATAGPLDGDVPLEVSFTGSGTDANGTVVLYEWDWEGDGTYDWSSTANGDTTHVYDVGGTFNPVLRVTDDDGLLGYDYSNIIRAGGATVEATANPTEGNVPLTVNFAATAYSPYTITLYEWDFNGDDSYDWSSSDTGTTSHAYDSRGIYGARVRATDEAGGVGTDTVLIAVGGRPVAVANANPISGEEPLPVRFDGSYSYDADGSIVMYEWDYDGDGTYDWTSMTAGVAYYQYSKEGVYDATVRVTDNEGLTGTATIAITVNQKSPVAVITAAPTEGNAPLEVTFDGSGSYDPDGTVVDYAWHFGDGVGSGVTTTHMYETPFSYNSQLTVTDDDGATGTASVEILVKPTGSPAAVANADPTSGRAPLTVQFTGTGTDPDGTIMLYEWDFDGDDAYDWSSAGTGTTSQTYSTKGQYTATLRVTDDSGLTAVDSVGIYAGLRPVALPTAYPTDGEPPLTVSFGANGADEDGTIVLYQWDFNGDGVYGDVGDVAYNAYIPHFVPFTYGWEGAYTPSLRVTDNDGLTGTASVTITVGVEDGNPVASASASPSKGAPPLEVALVGTGTDLDGTITAFEWDFDGDGIYDWTSNSTGTTTHTYNTVGVYNAALRVTDNDGKTGTDTVLINVKPDEAPTAAASASPSEGPAALTVTFNGSGTDSDGTIVLYEWDFDGDGIYEGSSTSSGAAAFSYVHVGSYNAVFRVTDDDGLTDFDVVAITVTMGISASLSAEVFDPTVGEEVTINSTLTGPCNFTLRMIDERGNPVRTLVGNVYRAAGFYSDLWDGRNDAGDLVLSGVYRFIMDYEIAGQTYTYDLSGTADPYPGGLSFYELFSGSSPYEDGPMTMRFVLDNTVEVTVYIGEWMTGVWDRVKTIWCRKPIKSGDVIITWDGTDDEGHIAGPGLYMLGVSYWDLPDNAVIVDSEPTVSDLSVEPNYFRPVANPYGGQTSFLTVTCGLSKQSNVVAIVQNDRNVIVRTLTFEDVPGGIHTFTWDGRNEEDRLVHPGDYAIGVQADAAGNTSSRIYGLFKVFY
jgi:PKD repeat protein